MTVMAGERFDVTAARQRYEMALRDLRTAEVHADFRREPDGSFQVVDQPLNPDIFAEIQQLQPALDAAAGAVEQAKADYDEAMRVYDEAARMSPLFEADNADPVLLLPVRMEAIYADSGGATELRIRVYPDDVHVDSYEPALTDGERQAGIAYWRAVRSAADDVTRRQAAWQALAGAWGGARAVWVRDSLTPLNAPPNDPQFPDTDTRAEAWTRAAHTQLLPDHFEFSAYADGGLVWRKPGAPIPDTLTVGIAPQPADEEAEPDSLAFDDQSRWLIEFDLAVHNGMGLAVALTDPGERFDLLTVVGVGSQDPATSAERVQQMLRAHAFSVGLTPLPVRTPTNNTPGTRSGWRSRDAPVDPDVAAAWRTAFKASGDQEAARLARALGIDGAAVLAGVCDPAGGDEALLRRLHKLQAQSYSWSPALRLATDTAPLTPNSEPWFRAVAEHYALFVRARGPLPPLRIGRQPYGLLPVSSLDLWRGDDVDGQIREFVASFFSAFAERASRALQVGEETDQDGVLLDLLSRNASPGRIVDRLDFTVGRDDTRRPPPATVGAIPASSSFAWLHADDPGAETAEVDPFYSIEPFPEELPAALRELVREHPLAQLLVLFDENLQQMRDTLQPPDPAAFDAVYFPLRDRLAQLLSAPTRSLFYRQAERSQEAMNNIMSSGPDLPERVAERIVEGTLFRDEFANYVMFEDDASADLPHFERLFRETFEPLSHRIDAWVSSLATARLAVLREQRPAGIRTGAYGWLTNIEPADPNPSREGYVMTPSMHHATTAAVLRSGWQAHDDRRAFAVDIQSARVRRAQSIIEGVRAGQTVSALLGYQFERALHDAQLDTFISGFRDAYPLAPLVEPEAPGADAARTAIGARNVVDGQALRHDRQRLHGEAELQAAAGGPVSDEDAAAIRRMLGELDETFDAVGDLLLAESVHQLVGGSALRAGLAADAVGRGQDVPLDYDVLRTPRGGIGATHHAGILFPKSRPGGWADDRPLARLQPGLEAWMRHRLGPASGWALGVSLADLGWCALDLLIAPEERIRSELAAGGQVDEARFADLMLVCDRLRSALAGSTPLTPAHLDAADPSPATGYDFADLHDRVGRWLSAVRAAAAELAAAQTPDAAQPVLQRLGTLGLPVGANGSGDVDRIRTLIAGVDLSGPATPPDPAVAPADADAWLAELLARAAHLLHPAVKVAPILLRDLPPAPGPPPDEDIVAAWLHDMTLVRPRVEAFDAAVVAAELMAGAPAAAYVIAQPVVAEGGAGPWTAVAPPAQGLSSRSSLVLQRDGAAGPVCGLVVDSWTEVVPRAPGEHGPEEVIGVAFDFDRPGARAPQAMLIAVPPDPDRGWCAEDLHACLDEALLLARVRTLDLVDLPELRTVLPIPSGG